MYQIVITVKHENKVKKLLDFLNLIDFIEIDKLSLDEKKRNITNDTLQSVSTLTKRKLSNYKDKKISFSEYFSLVRKMPNDFIDNIALECGVTDRTVYNWINGSIIPDKSHQDKISSITGIPSKYLFKQWELIDNTK